MPEIFERNFCENTLFFFPADCYNLSTMEYIEVLNKIIEAERAARQIAGEAKAERDNLPRDLRAGREEMRSRLMARAERRVRIVREQEDAVADGQLARLENELQNDLLTLESHFRAHRDEMAGKLFGLVTGV